jgi:hypothetical protein
MDLNQIKGGNETSLGTWEKIGLGIGALALAPVLPMIAVGGAVIVGVGSIAGCSSPPPPPPPMEPCPPEKPAVDPCNAFVNSQDEKLRLDSAPANAVNYLWRFQEGKAKDDASFKISTAGSGVLVSIHNRPEGLDLLTLLGAQQNLLRPLCVDADKSKGNAAITAYVKAESDFWKNYAERKQQPGDSPSLAAVDAMAPAAMKDQLKTALGGLLVMMPGLTQVEAEAKKAEGAKVDEAKDAADAFQQILVTYGQAYNKVADAVCTDETRYSPNPKVKSDVSRDARKAARAILADLEKQIFGDEKSTTYTPAFQALYDRLTVDQQKIVSGLGNAIRSLRKGLVGGGGGGGGHTTQPVGGGGGGIQIPNTSE